jgi:hypothetical protein
MRYKFQRDQRSRFPSLEFADGAKRGDEVSSRMVSDAERGALVQVEDGGLELFGFGAKAIQFTDFARGVNPFTSR